MLPLRLGFSTCPNDTFIFHAMTHGLVDCGSLYFDTVLRDVEVLNQMARTEQIDVTKLSFAALGQLQETYGLIESGAALGRGCGPLIVSRPGLDLKDLPLSKIAVPGFWTTAYLLLGLYLNREPNAAAMGFDRIMPALGNGDYDFGVIIHEGRFTYESHGLTALLDLGQWWEDETGLPIPLGCIAVKRCHGTHTAQTVEHIIRESICYGLENPHASRHYIKNHAQELADEVVDQHISLYVNDNSIQISSQGLNAINTLFERGRSAGLLPDSCISLRFK